MYCLLKIYRLQNIDHLQKMDRLLDRLLKIDCLQKIYRLQGTDRLLKIDH